jgi:hypothetical protein
MLREWVFPVCGKVGWVMALFVTFLTGNRILEDMGADVLICRMGYGWLVSLVHNWQMRLTKIVDKVVVRLVFGWAFMSSSLLMLCCYYLSIIVVAAITINCKYFDSCCIYYLLSVRIYPW